jgi:hypothetical protein
MGIELAFKPHFARQIGIGEIEHPRRYNYGRLFPLCDLTQSAGWSAAKRMAGEQAT